MTINTGIFITECDFSGLSDSATAIFPGQQSDKVVAYHYIDAGGAIVA